MFTYCPQCRCAAVHTNDNHQFSCSNCDWVYFHNMASAVAGLIQCGNELAFTRRAKQPGLGLLDKDILYHTCDAVFTTELTIKPFMQLDISEIEEVLWLDKTSINLQEIAFDSLREAVRRFWSL